MRRTILSAMTALMLCAPALRADPAGDARRAIQAAYAAMDAATAHKDVSGATAYTVPSYTLTDTHGKVTNVAQSRQATARIFAMAQSLKSQTTIVTFTLNSPSRATVTERGLLAVTLPQTAQTGRPINAQIAGTTRDIWAKTTQGWREMSGRMLTDTFTVNGKTMPAP